MTQSVRTFHLVDSTVLIARCNEAESNAPVYNLEDIRELAVGQDAHGRVGLSFRPFGILHGALPPVEKSAFSALHCILAFQPVTDELEKGYLQSVSKIQLI